MTILSDIWAAIEEAEKLPFALELGISGQHAFAAAAGWVEKDGTQEQLNQLIVIQQLKRVDTPFFDGWQLLFNDYPNPFHRQAGRKAA